jgi:hypothetical protein
MSEFTLRAVILGIILGLIFGVGNAYLGLKVGTNGLCSYSGCRFYQWQSYALFSTNPPS